MKLEYRKDGSGAYAWHASYENGSLSMDAWGNTEIDALMYLGSKLGRAWADLEQRG